MADDPGRDDNDPDEGKPQDNPLEDLFRQLGFTGAPGQGSPDLAALMQQLQQAFGQMFSAGAPGPTAGYTGFANPSTAGGAPSLPGQVDWRQVSTVARRICAERGSDPEPSRAQRDEVTEVVRIAESWLDRATTFPAVEQPPLAWSRSEWITSTLPVWQRIISPVATSFADALADALLQAPEGAEQPPELAQMTGMLKPMLRTSGAMMYGTKLAEALGRLAGEVLGLTDIGLPLGEDGQVVLLPTNVNEFAEGLEQSPTDIRVYLALREAARQRLFAGTPWLRPQLLSLFEQYAAGIRIDMSAMEEIYRDLDPTSMSMEGMQQAFEKMQGSLFEPVRTPEQQAVLERLETLMALIEGWVDDTVTRAAADWMPSAPALAETMRRRRATGGPAEETLATLVGLELRPRRLRDAANLWAALGEARGLEGRDEVWSHPDNLPTATGLDDPIGFVAGEVDTRPGVGRGEEDTFDIDAELQRLLERAEEERGEE